MTIQKTTQALEEALSVKNIRKRGGRFLRPLLFVAGTLLFAAFFLYSWTLVYIKIYEGKAYPGVYAGDYPLGGLNKEEIQNLAETYNNRLAKEGADFIAMPIDGRRVSFKLTTIAGEDTAAELARVDSIGLAEAAISAGRDGKYWQVILSPWRYRLGKPLRLLAPVEIDNPALRDLLKVYLAPLENGAANANIRVTDVNSAAYVVAPERAGNIFVFEKSLSSLAERLSELSFAPVEIIGERFLPTISAADVRKAAAALPEVLAYGDLGLNFVDPQSKLRRDWTLAPARWAEWLEVRRDNDDNLILSLRQEDVEEYLAVLRYEVEQQAKNAKFIMADNDRTKEFQASRPGLRLNIAKTYAAIDSAFRERNYHSAAVTRTVSLEAEVTEPDVKIADVNDLGIVDLIGTGTSTFYDSHTNRIKNIANAVKRLNGTLIKPGEEFSALKYAGPFTAASGFLPEDVIKGKEIKKEIGGGMCQIGTTLFRMAMNSGMPITERRNHSLVVHYYLDPVNHNPGTDATVYEPLVDFKFLNDTGNYLLLQAEIDYEKQMLIFSLWGKPDGRRGWYSRPLVSRWIGAGAAQEIITTKLKAGEKKCQNAFRGAVARFTYTRLTPAGETIERVFDSYYRPLPKICMLGVAKIPEGCKEKEVCEVKVEADSSAVVTSTLEVGEE